MLPQCCWRACLALSCDAGACLQSILTCCACLRRPSVKTHHAFNPTPLSAPPAGEKVLVFAHHQSVLDELQAGLGRVPLIRIDGGVSAAMAAHRGQPICTGFCLSCGAQTFVVHGMPCGENRPWRVYTHAQHAAGMPGLHNTAHAGCSSATSPLSCLHRCPTSAASRLWTASSVTPTSAPRCCPSPLRGCAQLHGWCPKYGAAALLKHQVARTCLSLAWQWACWLTRPSGVNVSGGSCCTAHCPLIIPLQPLHPASRLASL